MYYRYNGFNIVASINRWWKFEFWACLLLIVVLVFGLNNNTHIWIPVQLQIDLFLIYFENIRFVWNFKVSAFLSFVTFFMPYRSIF